MKIFAFLFFCFFSVTGAYSQWQQTAGPSGGGVSEFAAIGNTIFTSSFALGNGVYASTDGGVSWHESGLQGIMLSHIVSHNNTLLASSTENSFADNDTLYRSSDAGMTWQKVLTFSDTSSISSFCFYQSSWFLAAIGNNGQMYRSDDDGLKWMSFHPEFGSLSFTEPIHLASKNTLVAGLSAGNGIIYYSQDGVSWSNVSALQDSLKYLASSAVDSNFIWMGGTGGVINGDGSTWNFPSDSGLVNKHLESIIALAAGSSNHLIAISSLNNVYYSQSGARFWTKYGPDAGLPANASFYFSASHIGTMFFIGSTAGIFSSIDDGTSWHFSSNGLRCADLLALTDYNGTLFSATEEGVFTSGNYGASWTNPQSAHDLKNARISGFYDNGSNLLAYGQGIYTWNGLGWLPIDNSDQVLGVAGNSGKLFAEFPALDFPSFIDPVSDTSKIQVTTNSGTSWQSVFEFPNSQDTAFTFVPNCMTSHGTAILAIQRVLPYVNFVALYRLYRSMDNGATWQFLTIPHTPACLSYFGSTLYMGTISDGLYISNDDGATWTAAGFNTKSDVTSIFQTQGVTFVSVATDGSLPSGMYWSNGGGWKYANTGMPNISGFFAADRKFLYSGGPSVWKRALGDFGLNDVKEISETAPIELYPNPAADIIHVHIPSPKQGILSLCDEKGSVVLKLPLSIAASDIPINLSGLADGIYLVRLVDKSGIKIANSHFLLMRK